MRIRPEDFEKDRTSEDSATRGARARTHAVDRLKSRKLERDYFGRPVVPAEDRDAAAATLTVAAVKGGVRLDAYLVSHGFAPGRDKAKVLIDSGAVKVSGVQKVKPSTVVSAGTVVEVAGVVVTEPPAEPKPPAEPPADRPAGRPVGHPADDGFEFGEFEGRSGGPGRFQIW